MTPTTLPISAVQAELRAISGKLRDFDQRLDELARAIEPKAGEVLPTQLVGGVDTIRRDLLSDASESLLALAELDEEAAARRLLETVDLLDRLAAVGRDAERLILDRPEAVAQYLLLRYSELDQEIVGAMYFDVQDRLLGVAEIGRGSFWAVTIEPRAILRRGLEKGAVRFILWHTHPSGNPRPSIEDKQFTRQLSRAAEAVGMEMRDHLVLGHGGRWFSMQREERDVWEKR